MFNEEMIDLIECVNTFQGEGPDSGFRILLCRFKSCDRVDNKVPCPWCDTLVKMRVQEEMGFSLTKIQNIVNEKSCGLMITGGEPGYGKNLDQTLSILNDLDYPVANVETNGCNLGTFLSLTNAFKPVKFIYSPKVFNDEDFNIFSNLVDEYHNDTRLYFKIVVPDNFDTRILDMLSKYNLNTRTYLMPKGKSRSELLESANNSLFDLAEEYMVNVSGRMHIMYEFV